MVRCEWRPSLLIAVLCQAVLLNLVQVAYCAGACPHLLVPSFGQLLQENGEDITQSHLQSALNISEGDSVVIQCADGYQLTNSSTNTTLDSSQSATTCTSSGAWSLDLTNLACVKESSPSPPLLSNFIIMIIVAAILGVVSLLLLTTTVACAVWAHRLKNDLLEATYVENEIAFARSQGAFTLSNPLAVVKDEDSSSPKPLYLTPDEMTEFEEKQKI